MGCKDYGSPAWSEPLPGKSIATAFLHKTLEENGTAAASKRSSDLHDEIEKLADSIRSIPIESPDALRAKALVAIFDCWPVVASSNTFSFGDEESHWSLFDALLSVTGLQDLFFSIEDRLGTGTA